MSTAIPNAATNLISVIIPSFNRAYILKETLPTYLNSNNVGEVIVVSDGSTDNTIEVVKKIAEQFPPCNLRIISHDTRLGAAAARQSGVQEAKNDFIMFGEDDVYVDCDYTSGLLSRLSTGGDDFASGRLVYLLKNEKPADAKIRFGNGLNDLPLLDKELFRINQEKNIIVDTKTIYSHALYMTKRKILVDFGFDQFYRNGAGYREETDTQVRAHLGGHSHIIAYDAFCFHMNFDDVPAGG